MQVSNDPMALDTSTISLAGAYNPNSTSNLSGGGFGSNGGLNRPGSANMYKGLYDDSSEEEREKANTKEKGKTLPAGFRSDEKKVDKVCQHIPLFMFNRAGANVVGQ
jgi:hypothetical protein